MKHLRNLSLVVATAAFTLVGCSEEEIKDNYSNTNDPEPKSFKVELTDKPGDYAALNIDITSVQVFNATSGWVVLDSVNQTHNVLEYVNGATAEIAYATQVENGTYTKLKITLDPTSILSLQQGYEAGPLSAVADINNTLTIDGSNEFVFEINETIADDQGAAITIDYDVAQSIKYNGDGTFTYKPKMQEVKNKDTGIKGNVEGTNRAAVLITNGTDTLSTILDQDAKFSFQGIQEGVYSLVIDPATEELQNGVSDTTISTITVFEGVVTSMGTISLGTK